MVERRDAYSTYFAAVKGGLRGTNPTIITYPFFNELSYLKKMKFLEDLKKEVNELHRLVVREELNKDQKELDL